MLTACDPLSDRVAGLDFPCGRLHGQPFALAELLARLRALSRRSGDQLRFGPPGGTPQPRLAETHRRREGAPSVSPPRVRPAPLLHAPSRRGACRPERCSTTSGTRASTSTNTVRVTVSKLRKKLADAGCPDTIGTVVGGYRLVA